MSVSLGGSRDERWESGDLSDRSEREREQHRAVTPRPDMETSELTDQSRMDKLNNNSQEKNNNCKPADCGVSQQLLGRAGEVGGDRLEFSRSRQLMSRLCAANPQFTASVLEDYIRPVFREGDVVLDIECGTNAALM